jgi:hypothetical protein
MAAIRTRARRLEVIDIIRMRTEDVTVSRGLATRLICGCRESAESELLSRAVESTSGDTGKVQPAPTTTRIGLRAAPT